MSESTPDTAKTLKVLVYSDDANVRQAIRTSLGRRPSEAIADVDVFDTATHPAVIKALDSNTYDVVILDGEAVPAGGLGICRQIKNEIFNCPPAVVIVGRAEDRWLATWSQADAIVAHPLDPRALVKAVLEVLAAPAALTS